MQRILAAALFVFGVGTAKGATISWAKWKQDTLGLSGTASGIIELQSGRVRIHYKGEVQPPSRMGFGRPEWVPHSTFIGGVVSNQPRRGDQVSFYGGAGKGTNVITFSRPVTNPIIAVYSLGDGGVRATLNFNKVSLSFESGGPTKRHRGGAITIENGNIVVGQEGNGTVQVNGTVSRISFTAPVYEKFCSITVGLPE